MHIVIIGGGAAGMATAHYLAKRHRVTVLERQSLLGGNIRTLNRNVDVVSLPSEIYLDSGVIEFHKDHSPAFSSLIDELGLQLEPIEGGSTSIYLLNGQCILMPGGIKRQSDSLADSIRMYARLLGALRHLPAIGLRMFRSHRRRNDSVGSFLGTDIMSRWIRMLLMYGYSIPYSQIDSFPSRNAIPTLLRGFIGTKWVRLNGGVYSYISEIVDQASSNLRIETDQSIKSIVRREHEVAIECSAGSIVADKLVFAVPPDQILGLLSKPDDTERRWFSSWQGNYVTTLIHTDVEIYARWNTRAFTEFDLFEKDGGDAGYNAYLNRLCGIPENSGTDYFLAYNLEDRIDPEKILHRQDHHTPLYTEDAARSVSEIRTGNGRNNTYFAGAFLYNGLHEDAIRSASAVKSLFGE
jgi:predicted NAD/FAD-binding protein